MRRGQTSDCVMTPRKTILLLATVIVTLSGCSGRTNDGVLTGTIRFVGRLPPAALSNDNHVVVSRGRHEVAREHLGKSGGYRFSLAPGDYAVTLSGPVTATPFGNTATVRAHQVTTKDLTLVFHSKQPDS